ncbi:MAG: hypothetical protein PUG75_08800 [Prevotella sp.]|nr:hypothetical protein [Prevotella sp.]MDY5258545.1 hypothetical protein [Prevotella sp.]
MELENLARAQDDTYQITAQATTWAQTTTKTRLHLQDGKQAQPLKSDCNTITFFISQRKWEKEVMRLFSHQPTCRHWPCQDETRHQAGDCKEQTPPMIGNGKAFGSAYHPPEEAMQEPPKGTVKNGWIWDI